MKTITKIALSFILLTCFSISVYAAGGDAVIIDGSNGAGPNLVFTPSGNTLLHEDTTANAYFIGAASEKTTTANGLEYCMVSEYNGYYQRVQETDFKVLATGVAGTIPTDAAWKAMGGDDGS